MIICQDIFNNFFGIGMQGRIISIDERLARLHDFSSAEDARGIDIHELYPALKLPDNFSYKVSSSFAYFTCIIEL